MGHPAFTSLMILLFSSRRFPVGVLLGAVLAVLAAPALAIDPFRTESGISATPAAALLPVPAGYNPVSACEIGPLPKPMPLDAAVERALCTNPKTRSAWQDAKAAAAAVGVSEAALLPTLDASAQRIDDHVRTSVADYPALDNAYSSRVQTNILAVHWVLFDFGSRRADIHNSRSLLVAAQAGQDKALQAVFLTTAKDYFDAEAARGKRDSSRQLQELARSSLEAASERVDKGVAPITDKLQAETAFAQTVYNLSKAEGEYQVALGRLAMDISGSPEVPVELPPRRDDGEMPSTDFVKTAHELLRDALVDAPAVAEARAQWQAAQARVAKLKAQGRPALSFLGQVSWNNQPVSLALGQPELSARNRDAYLGLKLEWPLFEGFGRTYQVRQAAAQAESAEDNLHAVEQQVAGDVWSSFQTLKASTENLQNTQTLV
jgi:outer membrane protein